MTKQQAINFLIKKPYKFGHLIGFTKLKPLHNEWMIKMLRGKSDATLQASRGSYKTTCVSIVLALILILLPNKRVLFVRKTDTDVKEIIKQVQKILLDPHTQVFVQAIYGVNLRLTIASATEISTNLTTDIKGTSQLVGIGLGSSLTGKHFDYIFTDDIVNVNDRISKAERDRTKILYQELLNVKNRDGRIFNTGTPWHRDDAFTLMPEPEKYDCYAMVDIGVMTEEEIADLKKRMSPALFAANYELRHIASEDVIFDDPQMCDDITKVYNGYSHCDAAFYGEDYTAFTAIAIHDSKFYVFGKCWRKHIDDVTDEICNWYNKLLSQKMYIETNADKGYVAKQFRNKGLRVSTYNESQNKYIKIVSYLKFEWQDVIFVEGTDDEYIDMICDYNEDAEHDDPPDSLASLIRILQGKKNRINNLDKSQLMFL